MGELLDMAVRACEAAVAAGADQAQASVSRSQGFSTSLELGAIKGSQAATSGGASIRAIYKGGTGTSSANVLNLDRILEASRTAAKLAQQADPDPDFVSLPAPQALPEIDGLYDDAIAGMSAGDAIRCLLVAADEALDSAPDALVSGGVGSSVSDGALANSLGVATEKRSTSMQCVIRVVLRGDDGVGMWFDYTYGHVMDDFRPDGIGRTAAEGAREYLGARDVASGDYPVVMGPFSAPGVYGAVASQANAEDIQRNRSYLIGKRGEKIASDVLTIVDEPLIARGAGSSASDSEGVPRKPLTIVENGVPKAHLHNSYTANKAGEENTGHASGAGIGTTNVNVKLGTRTAAEMIAEIDDGILITSGGPNPDRVTGDFSSTVDFGFKIENGEIAYPIRNAAIGGSFLEFLQDIEEISSDYRDDPGEKMPSMSVKKVRLAGSA